jgi:hypothetical protein
MYALKEHGYKIAHIIEWMCKGYTAKNSEGLSCNLYAILNLS